MRCNIHSWRLQVSPRSINYWIGFYHFIHYAPRRRYIALSMFFSSCVGLRLPRAADYAAMVLTHVTWQPTAYFPTSCSSGYYPPYQHPSSASVSPTYHPILWPLYLPNPLPPSKSFIRNNTIKETPGYVWAPNSKHRTFEGNSTVKRASSLLITMAWLSLCVKYKKRDEYMPNFIKKVTS